MTSNHGRFGRRRYLICGPTAGDARSADRHPLTAGDEIASQSATWMMSVCLVLSVTQEFGG
jgi:hypothetical protein